MQCRAAVPDLNQVMLVNDCHCCAATVITSQTHACGLIRWQVWELVDL